MERSVIRGFLLWRTLSRIALRFIQATASAIAARSHVAAMKRSVIEGLSSQATIPGLQAAIPDFASLHPGYKGGLLRLRLQGHNRPQPRLQRCLWFPAKGAHPRTVHQFLRRSIYERDSINIEIAGLHGFMH